jgi:Fe-S-cluster containining protein
VKELFLWADKMENFLDRGLRFSCTGCRRCCGEEPGYVFLSKEDISRLAKFLSMGEKEFMETYCRYDAESYFAISLLEKENYDCIFLTEGGCSVYEERPLQCRTYPFWRHVVSCERNWMDEGKQCPGIGQGKLHGKEEIELALKAMDGRKVVTAMGEDGTVL